MASNIVYRITSDVPAPPRGSPTIKNSPLTSDQIDGNFKLISDDIDLRAMKNDALLTGTPTLSSSPPLNDNSTRIATTAYVISQISDDAPTKTGSGASGTWNIDISGNAVSANTAINCSNRAHLADTADEALAIKHSNNTSSSADIYPLMTATIGTGSGGNSYPVYGTSGTHTLSYVPTTGTFKSTNFTATTLVTTPTINATTAIKLNNTTVVDVSRNLVNVNISGAGGANSGLKTLGGITLFGSGDYGILSVTYGGTGYSTLIAKTQGEARALVSSLTNGATSTSGYTHNIDTSGGAIGVYLPLVANTAVGDSITFVNVFGNWLTNNFTLNMNVNTRINGINEPMICNTRIGAFTIRCGSMSGGIAYWYVVL